MTDYIERDKVYEMLNALGGCGAKSPPPMCAPKSTGVGSGSAAKVIGTIHLFVPNAKEYYGVRRNSAPNAARR